MDKPHYHGHRERLRKSFSQQGLEGFQDYEALELLLLYVVRQRDMKPVAKALVDRFHSFKNVLDAPREELQAIDGVGSAAVALIHPVKQAAARYLQQTSRVQFPPESPESLTQYCILDMGAEPNEMFRVICLDSNFVIIREVTITKGTVDQATVYRHKVAEAALEAKATSLLFVHNHPDGNVTPSDFDKILTRALALATKTVGITVYDHIIVSRDTHFSFREHGLL